MNRKTLPNSMAHPTTSPATAYSWGTANQFGGYLDRIRLRRATYLMRTLEIVL